MTQKEYEARIAQLEKQLMELQNTCTELLTRNMQLSQQLDAFYDVRRRIQMLKELVIRHQELMHNADLRDDDELMALIEVRLEQDLPSFVLSTESSRTR